MGPAQKPRVLCPPLHSQRPRAGAHPTNTWDKTLVSAPTQIFDLLPPRPHGRTCPLLSQAPSAPGAIFSV